MTGRTMDEPPAGRRPRWLAARLSVQMFLAYGVQGAWVPVFSVYLHQLGFSPAATAWAFTPYSLCSLVSPLLWGQVADRWVPAERCISACAIIVTAALLAIPLLDSGMMVFLACVLFWFFMIPINSLGVALTLRQLEHPERSYGGIRLWGTVGWAGAGLLLTWWLRTLKPTLFAGQAEPTVELADSFGVAALFAIALFVYSVTLPSTLPSRPVDVPAARGLARLFDAPLTALRLCRERAFLTFGVCLFGTYFTMPFASQLTPLLLEQLGVGRDVMPMALTAGQSTEVAMLAVMPWLLGRLGARTTMAFGIGAWALGMVAYAVGQPVSLVVAAMTTNGVYICGFLIAGQVFVNRQSAPDVRASAQGLIVWIGGVGLLIGHLLVGEVRELTGDDFRLAFLPPACVSVVLVVVFLTGFTSGAPPAAPVDSLVTSREIP
jgi:MFS family permease